MDSTSEKYSLKSQDRRELFNTCREIKHDFQVELSRSFQHYLPLDNDFLQWLRFFCPKIFIEKSESEAQVVKVAKSADLAAPEEEDDLKREIREIKEFKEEVFGKDLETYVQRYVELYKLEGKEPNIPVDAVWKHIIEKESRFPLMSRVLKSVLSIFHSTATVEGAINTTRNILGERAHNLLDKNLNARKIVTLKLNYLQT